MNSEEITVEAFHVRVCALRSTNKGLSFTFCPDSADTKFGPVNPILLYIKTL